MIKIEITDYTQMKCNDCTHRHVCMYRKSAEESTQSEDSPFITAITECKYYSKQTLEQIKIN